MTSATRHVAVKGLKARTYSRGFHATVFTLWNALVFLESSRPYIRGHARGQILVRAHKTRGLPPERDFTEIRAAF